MAADQLIRRSLPLCRWMMSSRIRRSHFCARHFFKNSFHGKLSQAGAASVRRGLCRHGHPSGRSSGRDDGPRAADALGGHRGAAPHRRALRAHAASALRVHAAPAWPDACLIRIAHSLSASSALAEDGEIEEQLHKLEQMVKLLIHGKFTPEQAHYFCLHALPRSTSAALRLRLPHGLAQRLAGYLHFVLEAAAALLRRPDHWQVAIWRLERKKQFRGWSEKSKRVIVDEGLAIVFSALIPRLTVARRVWISLCKF